MNTKNENVLFEKFLIDNGYSWYRRETYIKRLDLLKKWISKSITTIECASQMNVCREHLYRIKDRYIKYGFKGLIHKSKNKRRKSKYTDEDEKLIISLFNGNYAAENKTGDYFGNLPITVLYKKIYIGLIKINKKYSYSYIYNVLKKNGYLSQYSNKFKETEISLKGSRRDIDYKPGQRIEADGTEFIFNG